jgi:hypothetical protein
MKKRDFYPVVELQGDKKSLRLSRVDVTFSQQRSGFDLPFQESHELAQNILEALAVAGFKPAPLKNNDHEDDEND